MQSAFVLFFFLLLAFTNAYYYSHMLEVEEEPDWTGFKKGYGQILTSMTLQFFGEFFTEWPNSQKFDAVEWFFFYSSIILMTLLVMNLTIA